MSDRTEETIMRAKKSWRVLFVVVLSVAMVAAMAPAGMAKKGKGPPAPEPETIWSCQDRVDNGAVWILGHWDESLSAYVSDDTTAESVPIDVALPLCIDIGPAHIGVTNWTVSWEGTANRVPKGLKFVFEEGVHQSVYAETEWTSKDGTVTSNTVDMVLDFAADSDSDHLEFVFVAMPRQGDKWTSISFTVTPNPPPPN